MTMAVPAGMTPNRAVAWVLMASYLYYIRDESLLSDYDYDRLTRMVVDRWSEVHHPHRHLVGGLRANASSTLFDVREDQYPAICRSAACRLARIPQRDPQKESL